MTGSLQDVQRVLVDQALAGCELHLLRDALPVTRAHVVQGFARHVAQPLRVVSARRHQLVERVLHEALLVHGLELRMSVEREFQQRRARTRKTDHEYGAVGGGRRTGVIPGRDIRGVAAQRRDRHVRQGAQRPLRRLSLDALGLRGMCLREHAPGVVVSTERIERAGDGEQAQMTAMKLFFSGQRAREQRFGFGMLPLALQ